jgi:hypothetical protein
VRIEEKYIRVALSSVARIATTQEVALSLEEDGALVVREAPRPGVFDPVLLKRVQKVVALLEASDVSHVDFGLLEKPLADASHGDYVERYGIEPTLLNFLFQAAPSTTRRMTLLTPAPSESASESRSSSA